MDWLASFDRAAPGLLLALAAGSLNSLSPCCLAMTPAYLAHLAGVEAASSSARARLAHAVAYMCGFSAIFVALGAGLSLAGLTLAENREVIWKVGGVVVIAFGLTQAGVFRAPYLDRSYELRFQFGRTPGYFRSFAVGAMYSIAWTPCIGPVLGAILTGVLVFGDLWQGVALLSAFAVGMAVPHLMAAIAFERLSLARRLLQRHYVMVQRVSGTVMVLMGILIFTGALIEVFRYFQYSNVVL